MNGGASTGSRSTHYPSPASLAKADVGVDLAKSILQVHGVDGAGEVALERRLRRSKVLGFFAEMEPCLSGMAMRPAIA